MYHFVHQKTWIRRATVCLTVLCVLFMFAGCGLVSKLLPGKDGEKDAASKKIEALEEEVKRPAKDDDKEKVQEMKKPGKKTEGQERKRPGAGKTSDDGEGFDGGETNVGADYLAAMSLIGDWEGFVVIDECPSADWQDRVSDAYARILFDEDGNLTAYMQAMFPEEIAFNGLMAMLTEAGTAIEWSGDFLGGHFISNMYEENRRLCMEADVFDNSGDKIGSFRVFLQQLDTDWPDSNAPKLNRMARIGYDVVLQNMDKLAGMSLEDRLNEWAKIMPKGAMHLDQLPDASLKETSEYNRVW